MKSEGFAAGGSGDSGDFGSAFFLFLPIEHSVSYNMDLIYEGTLTKEALTMIEGRIYNFSAGPSSELRRFRYVRSGDEPQIQSV